MSAWAGLLFGLVALNLWALHIRVRKLERAAKVDEMARSLGEAYARDSEDVDD